MDSMLFVVDTEDVGGRLDVYLTDRTDFSRSRVRSLLDNGHISVNGTIMKSGYSLRSGDEIIIEVPPTTVCSAIPQEIPVDIIYEDDSLIVVNKAQGMVTHPSDTTPSGTLVNALMFHTDRLSTINGVIRPGIVHRLDRDTSGLLVVAKTDTAHLSLQHQIAEKTAHRHYLGLVDGNIKTDSGEIVAPVGRSPRDRKKMAVVRDGRYAETHYIVRERYGKYTLVEFILQTGRTHQIRVHASHMGHAIVGDSVYGGSMPRGITGQLLHAYLLTFVHPITGQEMSFTAPLPQYYADFLASIQPLRRD